MPNPTLMQAVLALINAESEAERKRVLEHQRDVLLTDDAEQLLNDWQAQSAGDKASRLQECLALLARYRKEAIEAAVAEQRVPRCQPAVLALTSAKTEEERKRVLERERDVLLTNEAEQLLNGWLVQSAGDYAQTLQECQTLLVRCRKQRIDDAFDEQRMSRCEQAIFDLMNAKSEAERKRIFESQRDVLQSDDVKQLLSGWVAKSSGGYARALEESKALVELWQKKGISTASAKAKPSTSPFSPLPGAHLWSLVTEVKNITSPRDMPRRIELCREGLTLVDRHALPNQWAIFQNALGLSLWQNSFGNRADNLEQAIYHYQQAQLVWTRKNYPYEWATSCNNLATAYNNRIKGERAQNSELAISFYEQALEVITRQTYPEEWAKIMNNLGALYNKRIRGEYAENIELAINYCQQAQLVVTRQKFPNEWANSCNSLADAYRNRIRGERAKNIELAIDYSWQAQQVWTRKGDPYEWATSCNNLGAAYLVRIRGERAQNLELAIEYYQQALEVYTRQDFREDWARSMNNLAQAYHERIKGERSSNIEYAIAYHEQALQVYTRQDFPYEWAINCNNLANALYSRIRGKRAQNIELAIDYYQQAQKVYTRQDFPYEWATSMNNLANAYLYRVRGESTENLELAIDCLKQALEVRTPQSLPQDCRDTAYALGNSLYSEERFAEAREAFVMAHEAVEALRGETIRERAKRDLGQENADLYARLVTCCLHDANADEVAAFEYAAAGKGRAFVDMLATTRFDLSAVGADKPELAADWLKYRELRQQIDNLRTRLTGQSVQIKEKEEERKQEWEYLRQLQQQELGLWEDLSYKYPALTATQSAPSLSMEAAQALATDLGATLVEFVQHASGWLAFVVTSEAVRHVPLPDVDDEFLREMVFDWLFKIGQPKFHNQESYWSLDEWYEALIMPLKPHLPPSGKVVLAPASVLHLVPLGIARHPDTLTYLCDEYTLSFAPSLAALRVTRQQAKKKGAAKDESGRLLAVAYPGQLGQRNYLSHAVAESVAIETHFSNVTRLYDEVATPQAVVEKATGQSVVHFSCHGTFDSDLPSQSGLALSGGYLTVQRIITELRLSDARLATLSACVTHRADLRAGEEHVGLVQSVLTAGAQSVVASLWSVPEQATRVLFEQFYSAVAKGEAPAQALTEAMRHVRLQPGWEHPFYWAAFQVSGLGYDLP